MKKRTLVMKCVQNNQRPNNATVMFALDPKDAPGAAAGTISAKSAVQLTFGDPKEAEEFKIGNDYKFTVEAAV